MKKFNSILAIAAVALTSVFGFTSCDKNDDMLNQPGTSMDQPTDPQGGKVTDTPAPSKSTYTYNLFVNDDVLNLGDVKVTIEQDGQSQEYKLSETQTITKTIEVQVGLDVLKYTYSGKMLVVNNVKSGAKVTPVFEGNEDAIAALQQDGHTDVAIVPFYNKHLPSGSVNASQGSTVYPGVKNVKAVSCINRCANLCNHTFE